MIPSTEDAAINQAGHAVMITDSEGTILYVNEAFTVSPDTALAFLPTGSVRFFRLSLRWTAPRLARTVARAWDRAYPSNWWD
jgi:hypothetical protein